jgi:hypothetical protein
MVKVVIKLQIENRRSANIEFESKGNNSIHHVLLLNSLSKLTKVLPFLIIDVNRKEQNLT